MAKHKKYTYSQIVKIVGYKVVNKWDTGPLTSGQFMKIFDKKLQEESK